VTQDFRPTEQKIAGSVRFDGMSDDDVIQVGIAITRFMDFLKERGVKPTEVHAKNLHMDLGACHSNGCPLDFAALNKMDLTPFVNDCIGIGKNLDRNTGRLMNGYRPRCARSVLIIH